MGNGGILLMPPFLTKMPFAMRCFNYLAVLFMVFILPYSISTVRAEEVNKDDLPVEAESTDKPVELDGLVVTATRSQRSIANVSQKVSIITAEEIEASGAETVAEALVHQSGVQIRSYGTTGSLQSVSIGGSSSSQVLVLIDGIRANDVQSGMIDFGNLPVENIERIEVLHGAASALYGADALGGVINIITKKVSRGANKTSLSVETSSFDSNSYKLTHERALDKISFFTTLKRSDARNDFTYFDKNRREHKRENNFYSAWHFFQKVDWEIDNINHLSLTGNYYDSEKGAPGSLAFPSPSARQDESNTNIVIAYKKDLFFVDNLNLEAKLHYSDHRLQFNNPDNGIDSNHEQDAYGLDLQQEAVAGESMIFTYGASIRRDNVESVIDNNSNAEIKKSRLTSALFLQDEINLMTRNIILIPALRYDHHSDFGGEVSPKAGLVYHASSAFTLRANYGTSFRAPTFNDLYWPEDNFAIGNPNLEPEEGKEFSVGLLGKIYENNTLNLNFFKNKIDNLILWQPGQINGKWSPVNISKAELSGFEAECTIKPSRRTEFTLNYTYLRAVNKEDGSNASGKDLPFKPRDAYNFTLNYKGSLWKYFIAGHYTGQQYSEPSNLIIEPDYFLLDAGLSLHPLAPLSISLDVKNILDKEYESVPSYPSPGRNFSIDVKYTIDWS